MSEPLGTATLTLEANLGPYAASMGLADKSALSLQRTLQGVTAASGASTAATNRLGAASLSSSRSHAQNSKELGNMERSARGGIGAFTGLGRAMFFASNAFLGGVLIGGTLKSIVDKTRELDLAMGQLKTALGDSGASWITYGGQVSATLKKQEDLSLFTKADLAASLTKLVQSTGSVTKAEQELGIATNLARSRNEDLATATLQVSQVGLGHALVMRNLNIIIPKVTTATDALKAAILRAKDAHQAYAPAAVAAAMAEAKATDTAATAARGLDILAAKTKGADAATKASSTGGLLQFQKAMTDLEVSLGQVLVPEITKLLDKLSAWMEHLNQTGKAQQDLKEGIGLLKDALHAVGTVIGAVDKATGSFKTTLEIVATMMVGSKLLGGFGALTTAVGEKGAAGAVGLLNTRLRALSKLAATAIVVTVAYDIISKAHTTQTGAHRYSGSAGWGNLWTDIVGNIEHPLTLLPKQYPSGGGGGGMSTPGALGAFTGASAGGMSAGRTKMLAFAQSMLGTPYLWGGAGPGGFDCSGLVQWAFANGLNVNIPHFSGSQAAMGTQVSLANAKAGDVVFTNYQHGIPQHEGLYAGNGMVIAAEGVGPADNTTAAARARGDQVRKLPLSQFMVGGSYTIRDLLGKGANLKTAGGIDLTGVANLTKLLGGTHSTLKPKIPTVLTGLNLLPMSLRTALTASTSSAATTTGNLQLKALHNEQADLEKAKKLLEAKLKTTTGKQHAAVQLEMANIDSQIKAVGKKIKTNLHDQAVAVQKAQTAKIAAIKASFAQEIADDKSNVTAALSTLSQELDKALQAKLQSYIDTVLGPKFFQGTDANGVGLKTPAEALLAQMQAVDSVTSLQDALDAAKKQLGLDQTASHLVYDSSTGITTSKLDAAQADKLDADKKAVEQAKRAIDENNLAIRATTERAQADKDYADAVKVATADEAVVQQQMDDALRLFGQGLLDNTATLGDLQGIVKAAGDGLDASFATLSTATDTAASVFSLSSDTSAASWAAQAAAAGTSLDALVAATGTSAAFLGSTATALLAQLADPATLLGVDFLDLRGAVRALSDVMWLQWLKLSAAGDPNAGAAPPTGAGDTTGAAGELQRLHELALSGDITPAAYAYMISGHKLQIPGLDTGGEVLKTGLAVVHAGETYSGVGKGLGTPSVNITVNGAIGNHAEIALQISRELQKLNLRGFKFGLA